MIFHSFLHMENSRNPNVCIPFVELSDVGYSIKLIVVNPGDMELYSTCIDYETGRCRV